MLIPEILDEVFGHIPLNRDGDRTLIACALVATRWTGPSQRRLFSSVSINDLNYQRWKDGVILSHSKIRLLRYVHSFYQSLRPSGGKMFPMKYLPRDSGEYLSALYNLRSIELVHFIVGPITEEGFHTCFSAFRETLTELSLQFTLTSFNMFVTLVDYFPNVTTVRLGPFSLNLDEGPVPPLSRPLRGKISIYPLGLDSKQFADRLVKLDPKYDELVIKSILRVETAVVESVLRLSPSTVKYLCLAVEFRRKHSRCILSSPCLLLSPLHSRWCSCDYRSLSTTSRVGIVHKLEKLGS